MGCWGRSRFALVVLSTQIIFLIFFALMATYDYEVSVEQRWFYPSKYKIWADWNDPAICHMNIIQGKVQASYYNTGVMTSNNAGYKILFKC